MQLLMCHTEGLYVRTYLGTLAEQFDADDGLRRGCLHSPVQAGLAVIVLSVDIDLRERAGRRVAGDNIHNLITRKRLIGCVCRVISNGTHCCIIRIQYIQDVHLAPPIPTFFFSKYLMLSSELLVQAYIRGVSPPTSV